LGYEINLSFETIQATKVHQAEVSQEFYNDKVTCSLANPTWL